MLHELDVVVGADFEAVDVSSLMVDPNSGRTLQGFSLTAAPSARAIELGSVTHFVLSIERTAAFTPTVSLVTHSPSPSLTVRLSQAVVAPPGSVTLTVTDTHPGGSTAAWTPSPSPQREVASHTSQMLVYWSVESEYFFQLCGNRRHLTVNR